MQSTDVFIQVLERPIIISGISSNSNQEDILERAVAAAKYAKRYVEDVEFYCEDAGRTDNEYLARV